MSYVFDIIAKEEERQNKTVELIASENFVSEDVRRAVGSVLTNKYTEGYPATRNFGMGRAGRYYGGCHYYDELEEYCIALWKKVFKTDYHVNVQPHSGSQANMAAYMSVLDLGDTILAMSLDAGGHLTHSSPVSFVSKMYDVVTYGVNDEGFIDYRDLEAKIRFYRPKMVVVGASAYSREIDFALIASIIEKIKVDDMLSGFDSYKPYFMVDMAHIAGLVAAGEHSSPFGYADIITTTTHKTLRGPRGGLIFCKHNLANQVDSAVFPRCQGGSLQHVIAGKAVCAEEACAPEFKEYIKQVKKNCKAMAEEFVSLGYEIVSGGTDNHLFLLDLRNKGISGLELQVACDKHDITLNKNSIPNDPRPPRESSGVRIGTAAMTTKGYTEEDFRTVARKINEIVKELQNEKD